MCGKAEAVSAAVELGAGVVPFTIKGKKYFFRLDVDGDGLNIIGVNANGSIVEGGYIMYITEKGRLYKVGDLGKATGVHINPAGRIADTK